MTAALVQPKLRPAKGKNNTSAPPCDFSRALGLRLRTVRKQRAVTLPSVEQVSGGRLTGAMLQSYEMDTRAITIRRLWQLSEFYAVPVSSLLPWTEESLADARISGDRLAMVRALCDAWDEATDQHRANDLAARLVDSVRELITEAQEAGA